MPIFLMGFYLPIYVLVVFVDARNPLYMYVPSIWNEYEAF